MAVTSLKISSALVPMSINLFLKGIQIMQYFLSHAPNKDASIWHQSPIGAVENISPNETAYFHRKAIIAQEYITSWKCDDEENRNIRWVKGLRENLDPYTLGDYVNWPDIDIKIGKLVIMALTFTDYVK